MTRGWVPPAEGLLLRIGTLRLPVDKPAIQVELRDAARTAGGRCRWIGRRLLDDPGGAEVVIVSVWNDEAEMEREIRAGRERMAPALRAAVEAERSELYVCRAHGAWRRDDEPCLLRIFRGRLTEGDPAAFDAPAAAAYVANFESNQRCVSIAAGTADDGGVVLVTLWTTWDAVVSATGGDLRKVLPVTLPGWAIGGTADHYEIVHAATDFSPAE